MSGRQADSGGRDIELHAIPSCEERVIKDTDAEGNTFQERPIRFTTDRAVLHTRLGSGMGFGSVLVEHSSTNIQPLSLHSP